MCDASCAVTALAGWAVWTAAAAATVRSVSSGGTVGGKLGVAGASGAVELSGAYYEYVGGEYDSAAAVEYISDGGWASEGAVRHAGAEYAEMI